MAEIHTFERVLWGFTVFLKAALVILLLYRKNHRSFPFFFVYTLMNFVQSVALFESYRIWGFNSVASVRIAWGSQALVTMARSVAVAEICNRILAKYRGVWRLAWRLLLGAAALVSLYSWAVSQGSWQFAILNLDRSLELAIASVIVLLFLFARYYEVEVEHAVRTLAIGFFLYSSFRVLNDTIWRRWLNHYTALWSLLGTVTFLASLLLWAWALRRTQPQVTAGPELLSESFYHTIAPEINFRLKALNEQLIRFGHVEGKRT
jgi:hypothetical protein